VPLSPPDQATEPDLPDAAEQSTLYDLLQVAPSAVPGVVRAAYHALAQTYHPDRNADPAAPDTMRRLNEAYELLGDSRRRKMYDLKLRSTRRLHQAASAHGIRRRTTCWRCGESVDPLVPYCGICHWLVCPSCRACGCEHPDWRRRSVPSRRPALVLAWSLTALFALLAVLLLSTHPLLTGGEQRSILAAPINPPLATSLPSPASAPTAAAQLIPAAPANPVVQPSAAQLSPAAPASPAVQPSTAQPTSLPTSAVAPTTVPPTAVPPSALPTTSLPAESTTAAPPSGQSAKAPTLPSGTPSAMHTGLVSTQGRGARLRAEPSLTARILEVLADGAELTEIGPPQEDPDRTWWQVQAPSGQQGWLDARLLEPTGTVTPDAPPAAGPD
jgi:DnaJ-like protein/SH3 domain-containing protein